MDIDTVKTVAVIVIGVLVLLAVAMAFLVRKVVTKALTVLVLLALAVAVYLQRDSLATCAKTCACSFFGAKVQISDPVLAAKCKSLVG